MMKDFAKPKNVNLFHALPPFFSNKRAQESSTGVNPVPFFPLAGIQPKPEVSQPSDLNEQEGNSPDMAHFRDQLQGTKGSGNPLPAGTKQTMEHNFGADFSQVKVHTHPEAVQMSKDISAKAFTHGSDIYFGSGYYNPESSSGKHLLAHELTHVVQQGNNNNSIQPRAERMIMPTKITPVGMPSDLSSLSTPDEFTVERDPRILQINSQLPTTRLPFTKDGWDGYQIANLLGQYDQISGTDSDAVRCVQAVALMSHILNGPDAARNYLSSIAFQRSSVRRPQGSGIREQTALSVIDLVRNRITSRNATFGDMYWVMEAAHDLYYVDAVGTPDNLAELRGQVTPFLDMYQRLENQNIWCSNSSQLLRNAALLRPGEQLMVTLWIVTFNTSLPGVPGNRRRNNTRKPRHTQINPHRDSKDGHQLLIIRDKINDQVKDKIDTHIRLYDPELQASGNHLIDLTNDLSFVDAHLFNDEPNINKFKYAQIFGKIIPFQPFPF